MTAKISMATCKRRLAVLWFIAAGVAFLLLVVQTVLGRYGERASDAWGWLLPTVMPTLSLMIGVVVLDSLGKGSGLQNADRFMFRLSFGLSSVYLLLVVLLILVQPFAASAPLELMSQSNLWMGPLQGLVTASLGAFFIKS